MLLDHWDMFWKNYFCCFYHMKCVCGAARLMKCLSVFKPHKLISLKTVANEPKVLSLPLQHSVQSMQRVRGSCIILPISFQSSLQIYRGHGEREKHSQIKRERERDLCGRRVEMSSFSVSWQGSNPANNLSARWHICCGKDRTLWCLLDTHCPLALYIDLTHTLDKKERKKNKLGNLKHVNQSLEQIIHWVKS